MYYLLLVLAITMELIATVLLKYSQGLTRVVPVLLCVIAYILCHIFYGKALEGINYAVAYSTWCGVGLVATAIISAFLFSEKISFPAIGGIALIIVGVVIVNVYSK